MRKDDLKWVEGLRGKFIVFDGPDGSGKTTQMRRFAGLVREAGLAVCEVRDPGGTEIGEQIRKVLLDPGNEGMGVRCEVMLYMASRAQLVAERIGPALEREELVVSDRFISSTLAYQGAAGGLEAEEIIGVGRVAVGGCRPDVVVIFDVDAETAAARLAGSGKRGRVKSGGAGVAGTLFSDRVELKGSGFQEAVRRGYLEQARAEPGRYVVIDGAGKQEEVFERLIEGIRSSFALKAGC